MASGGERAPPPSRLLVRRQGPPDSDQRPVGLDGDTGVSEIGIRRTEREAMDVLVEPGQGVDVMADDLQIVNSHLETPSVVDVPPSPRVRHRTGLTRSPPQRSTRGAAHPAPGQTGR